MIHARIRIVLSGFLVLGLVAVACHRSAPVRRNAGDRRVVKVKDTAGVARVLKDTTGVPPVVKDRVNVVEIFKDTAPANAFFAEGRIFKLPADRQSLRASLRKERELWQAGKPREYRFLLRVGCFCPGTRGWLLIEVRSGTPLRAWDTKGEPATLTDWNTFSIDDLYDSLERSLDRNAEVRIAFDPRWHFPRYVSTVVLPGPDAWSVTEARGFRPN